jgi:exonuclease III
MSADMKGIFWNCRGIRKKGLSSFLRDLIKERDFNFICFQETIMHEFSDSCLRSIDPSRNYLWDWIHARGKSGGVLTGIKIDRFDVGQRRQGEFILLHHVWDKKMGIKWNILNVYGAAQEEHKDGFLAQLAIFCSSNKEPYIVGGGGILIFSGSLL